MSWVSNARVGSAACLGALGFLAPTAAVAQADPFAADVRTTPPRSPEDEQRGFRVPPGFEMQLFAAEPDIAKPINMAFDARGRLWITQSVEYPYPVPPGQPARDAVKILEDTDGDGRADRISTFADGLNIPIGIQPYRNGAVVWSIPNIWFLADTDGDGKADRREKLYGPLGWQGDTHGMSNTFRRGLDGWMYLTHGFENKSMVRGKDGSRLELESGNTYRVRFDGSRVEPHSWGQANPFGGAFDPLGNLYTADSHSAPIYQVLRGAYYPSFGRPPDGMGFGPVLMEHSHNSTAIAGLVYYADNLWPEEFRDNIFIGNVVTSRVNRDHLTFTGTTPKAIEQPDLVTTDDPWFRPVDLQMGPDGALYIADFYNRIIGHYEVPLDHPGRDRERGRIWRLSYKKPGAGRADAAHAPIDLKRMALPTLVKELSSPSPTRRTLATAELADRGGAAVLRAARAAATGRDPYGRAHALWVLYQLHAIDSKLITRAARDPSLIVRTHAMHMLSEVIWTPAERKAALAGLGDVDVNVARAAADAVMRHGDVGQARTVLTKLMGSSREDTHLVHVLRLALRGQLTAPGAWDKVASAGLSDDEARALADVALGVPTSEAALFLLRHIRRVEDSPARVATYVRHAARYIDGAQMDELATVAREKFAGDLDLALGLFRSVQEGAAQRGETASPGVEAWGQSLAALALDSLDEASLAWQSLPVDGTEVAGSAWFLKATASEGSDAKLPFLTSRPGARRTGILRSPVFALPAVLSFYLAGQDGRAGKPAEGKIVVRLRAAGSDEILGQWRAPRNDTAQLVTWKRTNPAVTRGYLELLDTSELPSDGWVAVGRFDSEVVSLPKLPPARIADRVAAVSELVRSLGLLDLAPRMRTLLMAPAVDLDGKSALLRGLQIVAPDEILNTLAPLLAEPALPVAMRLEVGYIVAGRKPGARDWRVVVDDTMRTVPYRVQAKLAQALASSPLGAETLLSLAEEGRASPRLLQDRGVIGRLESAKPARLDARVNKLVAELPPVNQVIVKLLRQRRAGFVPGNARPAEGAQVFARACAACHRIDGQGGLIGPQLDGVGHRGVERILEDVLDPNRNVDHAFRAEYVTLLNDEVFCGLPRRDEGAVVVMADQLGKERSIARKDIKERRDSDVSLMPDNFGEALSQNEVNHLLAFLLSKTKPGASK